MLWILLWYCVGLLSNIFSEFTELYFNEDEDYKITLREIFLIFFLSFLGPLILVVLFLEIGIFINNRFGDKEIFRFKNKGD